MSSEKPQMWTESEILELGCRETKPGSINNNLSWIPITEKLPDSETEIPCGVICYILPDGARVRTISTYSNSNGFFIEGPYHPDLIEWKVTHYFVYPAMVTNRWRNYETTNTEKDY